MKWISYGFWPCFWMVLNCRAFQVSVVMIHIWSKIKTDNWHILVSIYIDSYHYNWYKIQLSTWTDMILLLSTCVKKYWMKCQLESFLHWCIWQILKGGKFVTIIKSSAAFYWIEIYFLFHDVQFSIFNNCPKVLLKW